MTLSPGETIKASARQWRQYPEYKDSGIEWLGEIPEHWEVKSLRYLFTVVGGSTPSSGVEEYWDGNILWVTPEDMGRLSAYTITTTKRQITDAGYESCGTTMVPSGSLVVSTRAPIGHLAIAGAELCTNQGCKALVFRGDDDVRFFYYQLLAARAEIKSWGQGSTFQEIGRSKLESIRLIHPPLPEQRAIANFLDRETARIDDLIAKRERLISLLEEKRTALISHTVTKGLDPDAPMGDSGVEWLGEIPEHWEVKRLKYTVTACQNGVWGDEPSGGTEDLVCVRVADFDRKRHRVGDLKLTLRSVPHDQRKGKALESGDLLIEKSGGGDLQPVGAVVLYDLGVEAVCSNFIARMPVAEDCSPFFLCYLHAALYAGRVNTRSIKQNTGIQNLDSHSYLQEKVGLPPFSEQQAIADFLDWETQKIDDLISRLREHIEKLREYRTALISAAVTGKIDVREEVPSRAGLE